MPPTKVTIAIPTYRVIPSMFLGSFLSLFEHTKKKYKTNIILVDNTYIDSARNTLIDKFLKNPSDYLFFVDSDMIIPQDAIERLMSHDKDMVSGIYFGRSQAGETHAMASIKENNEYRRISSFPKGLIDVDSVGLGCCLIKKQTIEKISELHKNKPLFRNKFFSRNEFVGEDFYFCELLKDAGFNIFVDPSVQCGHIGGIIDTKYYLANKK